MLIDPTALKALNIVATDEERFSSETAFLLKKNLPDHCLKCYRIYLRPKD